MSSSGGNGDQGVTLTVGSQVFSWGDSSNTFSSNYAQVVGDSCEVLGCLDPAACNYISFANTDDGSCYYPEVGYNCDFEFLGCPEGTDSYVLNAYDSGNDGWG